jgi:hypothetical protein
LSGANEPIASLIVEEIATKFRFGDAGQLCTFAKDNVVITPISPPLSPDIANGPHTPRWYSAMHFLAIIVHATDDITLQPKLKLNWCTANFLLQGLIGTRHAIHPIYKKINWCPKTTSVLSKRPTVKKNSPSKRDAQTKTKDIITSHDSIWSPFNDQAIEMSL